VRPTGASAPARKGWSETLFDVKNPRGASDRQRSPGAPSEQTPRKRWDVCGEPRERSVAPRRAARAPEGNKTHGRTSIFRATGNGCAADAGPRSGAKPRSRENGRGATVAETRNGCFGGCVARARECSGRGFFEGCEVRRGEVEGSSRRLERATDRVGVESPWKRGEPRPAPVAIHRRPQRGGNRRGGLEPRGRNENCGWNRSSEGGQPPGVDAPRVNRRRGTQRTIARKVQFSVVGGGEEPPPAEPGVGQPAWRGTAAARASTRAGGATLRANDSPPGARGNLPHRPGFAGPTSVGPVARPAACPSSAIPRRPRGKGRTVDREGARASATRSDGGWTLRRGGRGTGGVSDCWETSGSELSPRLGPARIGAGDVGQVHEGASCEAAGFSAPRIAILPDRETRIRQLETAKARGRGEPSSHYRFGEEAVAADPPRRQAHAP